MLRRIALAGLLLNRFHGVWSVDVSKVPEDPDQYKEMVELVETRGYPIETHVATTLDGYELTMFRIPYGKNGEQTVGGKAPVILQHGLLDSSYTWVNNFENESLGYILADNGFDVWFGNNRGNSYGRDHVTLDPDDGTEAFWTFSFDEMGLYDLPSFINYVLDQTGYETVGYVGHSEGTIQMFVAASSTESSQYVSDAIAKVNIFIGLAPVAYVGNLQSELLVKLAQTDILQRLQARGVYEFLPNAKIEEFAPEICELVEHACDFFIGVLCGPTNNINVSRYQVYVSETPAGTSIQNVMHWEQGVLTSTFQKYDWGTEELNMQHYGAATPPAYDLSKVRVKTALFSGSHDYLADPKDVDRLIAELPSDSVVFTDTQRDYAHLDFPWAMNANERIYPKVISLLSDYSDKKN